MTGTAARGGGRVRAGRPRRVLAVPAVALVALVTAGCALVGTTLHTTTALDNAGFSNVKINLQSSAPNGSVTVSASPSARVDHQLDAQGAAVAQVVWLQLQARFDELAVNLATLGSKVYTYQQLAGAFGARPSNLDRQSIDQQLTGAGVLVLVIVGVVGLVVVGLVILVVVLVTRRRRRPPFPPTGAGPWAPPGTAGPYPQPGAGPYPQPGAGSYPPPGTQGPWTPPPPAWPAPPPADEPPGAQWPPLPQ